MRLESAVVNPAVMSHLAAVPRMLGHADEAEHVATGGWTTLDVGRQLYIIL